MKKMYDLDENKIYLGFKDLRLDGWYECEAIRAAGDVYECIAEKVGIDLDSGEYLSLHDCGFRVAGAEGTLAEACYSHRSFDFALYNDLADYLDSNPGASADAMVAYLEYVQVDRWDSRDFEDAYMGKYETLAEFVEEIVTECGEVPDNLISYIDWEAMARDWEGDYYFVNGFVFSSR